MSAPAPKLVGGSHPPAGLAAPPGPGADRFTILAELERKVLWLASWTIHHANHCRPRRGGLKVGGHQASCASLATLMTALYLDVLRPEDRVAVKPHASPVFHAIQYLLGHQSRAQLERFRALGGAQSYPSRTKDRDDVDFSTGSVGLGAAMTCFASLAQDYLLARRWLAEGLGRGRMVALVGDAELDEGNVYEALLEGWKHRLRNLWWVIDYNRQSLDAVVAERLFARLDNLFTNMGWRVVTLKYGQRLERAFAGPGGEALRRWIDECPNELYSALVFKGGAAWREHLARDIGSASGVRALLDEHDDEALAALMTNLAGHDMRSVVEAFEAVEDDQPTCFIAYTIKGFGLPMAGHRDNHAGLMSPAQVEELRERHGIAPGEEWEPFAGLRLPEETLRGFLARVPFAASGARRYRAARIAVPRLAAPPGTTLSTQEAFGRILAAIARGGGELGARLVTASPDVTVSTNLGGWVNRKGIFDRHAQDDAFSLEQVATFQRWARSPRGQHIELGIAENNLFLLLAALGLAHELFGARLLPVGTVYDPFIKRGLDALNYACYQDARFLLVATPSGLALAPEGGAHQSFSTPMIGIAQHGLAAFEPAYADELATIMTWAFEHLQREAEEVPAEDLLGDARGGSVYLRLSTRPLAQPERVVDEPLAAAICAGGYWAREPAPEAPLAVVYSGVVAPEAQAALAALAEDYPGTGLLAVTSADRLLHGWHAAQQARARGIRAARSHVEGLLGRLPGQARLITVIDGHPGTLAWLGSVRGQRVVPLGVTRFGQSGDLPELFHHYRIDEEALLDACATALLER